MENSNKEDNTLYIELLLSQINYLRDNLHVLRDFLLKNPPSPGEKKSSASYQTRPTKGYMPQENWVHNPLKETNIPYENSEHNLLASGGEISFERHPSDKLYSQSETPNYTASNDNIGELPVRQALKNVISLNDKFTFVRYLFKNNITIYSEHINNIDKLGNKDEVLTYINTYLSKLYNWDNYPEKKEAFIKIVEGQFEK